MRPGRQPRVRGGPNWLSSLHSFLLQSCAEREMRFFESRRSSSVTSSGSRPTGRVDRVRPDPTVQNRYPHRPIRGRSLGVDRRFGLTIACRSVAHGTNLTPGTCFAPSVPTMTSQPRSATPTCQRSSAARNSSHFSSPHPARPCATSQSASTARLSATWASETWSIDTTPVGSTTGCPPRPEAKASPHAPSPRLPLGI